MEPERGVRKQGLKLYDAKRDELGLFNAHTRQTEHGQFHEAADLAAVQKQLKKLGYHGYLGLHPDRTAVTLFADHSAGS